MDTSLEGALSERLAPGMTVFMDSTAMAAARAMVKVFAGTSPRFTVVVPRGGMIVPELVAGGVVAKIVAGGLLNPRLGRIPPPVIQQAYRSGSVEFELLTLQSIGLRLMAGAMGWPFVPSRSIAGSDLEDSFPATVQRVRDPFSASHSLVLRPLVADVAIGHAVVADSRGQTRFPDSSDHGGWGMRSTRRGVIVIAEALVDELTQASPGQRHLPASQVLDVVRCRHAAHPYGFDGYFPSVAEPYGADQASISAPPAQPEEPARRGGHGFSRLPAPGSGAEHALRPRRSDGAGGSRDISTSESAYLAGSELVRRVLDAHLRAVLEGSGKAKAVTDFAAAVLSSRGIELDRVAGIGGLRAEGVGRNPLEAYGVLLGGPERRSIGCISALQVDRTGSINNTVLAEGPTMLVGSGGANDAAAACDELMILTSGDPRTLVRSADFVTVPGSKVTVVVAGRCVFVRSGEGILQLARVLDRMTPSAQALLERADECGWRVHPDPEIVPLPDLSDRALIDAVLARSR